MDAPLQLTGDLASWAGDTLSSRNNVFGATATWASKAAKEAVVKVLGGFEPPEPGSALDVFGAFTLCVLFAMYWARGAVRTMQRCGGVSQRANVGEGGVGVGECTSENVALGILVSSLGFVPAVAVLAASLFVIDTLGFSEMSAPFVKRAPGAKAPPRTYSIGVRIITSWLLDVRLLLSLAIAMILSTGFAFGYLKIQELRRVEPRKWKHSIRVALVFNLVVTLLMLVGQKACDVWWRSSSRYTSAH